MSANLLHIAICNKWYLIALHVYCNRPVIYWQRSETDDGCISVLAIIYALFRYVYLCPLCFYLDLSLNPSPMPLC